MWWPTGKTMWPEAEVVAGGKEEATGGGGVGRRECIRGEEAAADGFGG
jgi:hypothetical protein